MPNFPQPKIGQSLDGTLKPSYPTPNRDDTQLVGYLESNIQDYLALLYGTPPPENTDPAHMLVSQVPVDWNVVQRLYAKDRTLEQTYNASIGYAEESAAHPTFTRDYIVRRSLYARDTNAIAMLGLIVSTVTNGGTGYTQATVSVSLSGGTGSGGAITAIVSNGIVTNLVITATGSYTVAPTVTINDSGTGAGATGTCAVQPQTCYLVKEDELRTPDSPLDGLYVLVRKIYETMPGPILTGHIRNSEFRGRSVDVTIQQDLHGFIAVETGDGVLSSVIDPLTSVVDRRTSKKFAMLPPTEVSSDWDFVSLPLLLFEIDVTYFCGGTQFFKCVVNPITGAGSAVIRKHRKTVSYSNTLPNPDLSASAFTTADIRYQGVVIGFSYQNVLNDAISYSQEFFQSTGGDACGWTEAYTFDATSPSATAFLAGIWVTKSLVNEELGDSMWKTTQIEYYSASGNPSI